MGGSPGGAEQLGRARGFWSQRIGINSLGGHCPAVERRIYTRGATTAPASGGEYPADDGQSGQEPMADDGGRTLNGAIHRDERAMAVRVNHAADRNEARWSWKRGSVGSKQGRLSCQMGKWPQGLCQGAARATASCLLLLCRKPRTGCSRMGRSLARRSLRNTSHLLRALPTLWHDLQAGAAKLRQWKRRAAIEFPGRLGQRARAQVPWLSTALPRPSSPAHA